MVNLQPIPFRREPPRDWRRYLRNHEGDVRWLAHHEEQLLAVIRRGIYTPPDFKDTVYLLMEIIPSYVMVLSHGEKWSPHLMNALLQAQDLKDNNLQTQLYRYLGEANLQSGKPESATDAFTIAIERAKEGQYREMLVASYAGLFKLQWFDLSNSLAPHLVQTALEIARQIDDLALKAALHDSLARAYSRMGETQAALGHAQTAYSYWEGMHNHGQLACTALLLVTIYRNIALRHERPVCLGHAEYFLGVARQYIGTTEYTWQDTLLAYQSGVLCLQRLEHEQAEKRFRIALSKAQKLGRKDYIALTYHGLGLAETGLRTFDRARNSLHMALKYWQEMNNTYEQASVLQALGYLEGLDGQPSQGLKYLYRGRKICRGLCDTKQRRMLEEFIQATIDEIKNQ